MQTSQIHFSDGAAYERYMGAWSQLAGRAFIDWLALPPGLRWLDVGCGNGAFTELLAARCAPGALAGIDPSPEQLAYAASRPALGDARLQQGDAMALPYPEAAFDVAVMPLVIFFVPEPARGVAEMVRVVRPGGAVGAYAWDLAGGGFPYHALQSAMRGLDIPVPAPPSPEASRMDVLLALWRHAGLDNVQTREISVERTFADFDDYWATACRAPSVGPRLAILSPADHAALKSRMRTALPADERGRIICRARANAIKGTAPA